MSNTGSNPEIRPKRNATYSWIYEQLAQIQRIGPFIDDAVRVDLFGEVQGVQRELESGSGAEAELVVSGAVERGEVALRKNLHASQVAVILNDRLAALKYEADLYRRVEHLARTLHRRVPIEPFRDALATSTKDSGAHLRTVRRWRAGKTATVTIDAAANLAHGDPELEAVVTPYLALEDAIFQEARELALVCNQLFEGNQPVEADRTLLRAWKLAMDDDSWSDQADMPALTEAGYVEKDDEDGTWSFTEAGVERARRLEAAVLEDFARLAVLQDIARLDMIAAGYGDTGEPRVRLARALEEFDRRYGREPLPLDPSTRRRAVASIRAKAKKLRAEYQQALGEMTRHEFVDAKRVNRWLEGGRAIGRLDNGRPRSWIPPDPRLDRTNEMWDPFADVYEFEQHRALDEAVRRTLASEGGRDDTSTAVKERDAFLSARGIERPPVDDRDALRRSRESADGAEALRLSDR
jgi:hypothetical protein